MKRYLQFSQFLTSRYQFVGLLLVIFLSTGACSFKTLYNQLDWLIPSYIEEYISLDPGQQAEMDRRLLELLRWHRQTQLPAYAALLQEVRASIAAGITAQSLDRQMRDIEQHWLTMMGRLAPDLAVMLTALTDKQREEMFLKVAKQNDEILGKINKVSAKQRLEELHDTIEANFRRHLGSLTPEQHKIIAHYAAHFEPVDVERLQARVRWQNQLRQLLDNHRRTENVRPLLEELLRHPDRLRDPAYRDKLNRNRERVKEMILEVFGQLNAAQKQHLLDDLDEWIRNFQELAQQ